MKGKSLKRISVVVTALMLAAVMMIGFSAFIGLKTEEKGPAPGQADAQIKQEAMSVSEYTAMSPAYTSASNVQGASLLGAGG